MESEFAKVPSLGVHANRRSPAKLPVRMLRPLLLPYALARLALKLMPTLVWSRLWGVTLVRKLMVAVLLLDAVGILLQASYVLRRSVVASAKREIRPPTVVGPPPAPV